MWYIIHYQDGIGNETGAVFFAANAGELAARLRDFNIEPERITRLWMDWGSGYEERKPEDIRRMLKEEDGE